MTGPVSPENLAELMAGYVLDNLDPEEAEEFGRLLAENPQLATEVNRLQESLETLPYALPEVELPTHLRSAILDATSSEINRRPIRKQSRLSSSKVIGSVAALVALALGLDNYRLRQELKTTQTQKQIITVLQQPNTRVFSLAGTDKADTASGSIVINLDDKKAVIVFQNLPTPPTDQIYRLWAIIDNKKIPCAQFSASPQGKVVDEFSLPATACSATNSTLAVTLEPLPAPPQPVGPAVMVERS